MKLHSVIISYNRLDLTQLAIESYLATVTLPYTLFVVDNGSEQATRDWLFENAVNYSLVPLQENRYPGYACNRGFELAPPDATHLHRADNDFRFLPGWCKEVRARFGSPTLGQLGLRTDAEECFAKWNVGGNMILRRELWDNGLRYDERPWPEYPAGYSEDSFLSPTVVEMGWKWNRVRRPCIESLASGDWRDPYYAASYGDRGIKPNPADPTAPGTT